MKAVIYIRVSSEEQISNHSLETQQKECTRYCQQNDWTVERVFREEGKSAKSANRPELQKMLAYCRQHKNQIASCVVYNLSRFSRDTAAHLAVRLELSKSGVNLKSVCEPIEDTSSGKFFETIMAAVSQLDNDMRGDRTVAGMKTAVTKGRWPFCAPIGYRRVRNANDEPTLEHDPLRAPLMRRAFEMYATGDYTKRRVLAQITAMGLTTQRGGRLSISRFEETLSNALYAGTINVKAWGQSGVAGNFKPIVSQDLFDRVQLASQSRRYNSPLTHERNHPSFPLRGSVKCGHCGHLLTSFFAKGRTKKYGYYGCWNPECDDKTRVPKERMEQEFEALLAQLKPAVGFMQTFRETVMAAWHGKHDQAMLGAITQQATVEEIEKKLSQLEEAYIFEKAVTPERYGQLHAKLQDQLVAAKVALQDCQVEELDLESGLNQIEHILANGVTLYTQLTGEQRRRLLAVLSPDGFRYDKKTGLKTVTSTCIFNVLSTTSAAVLKDGVTDGI